MRRSIGYIAAAAFGMALVATCGTVKVDNGRVDLGNGASVDIGGLFDVAAADAQPPTMLKASCDKVSTVILTANANNTTTNYYYWAEFAISGLTKTAAPAALTVMGCDWQSFPGGAPFDFNQDYFVGCNSANCQSSGYLPPASPCIILPGTAQVSDGKLVVWCGQRTVSITNGTSSEATRSMPTTVYVSLN